MRRREHEEILKEAKQGHVMVMRALALENDHLRRQNDDLLNRCMSKDWTQYTALSAEPDPWTPPPDILRDDTGLIEAYDDEPRAEHLPE